MVFSAACWQWKPIAASLTRGESITHPEFWTGPEEVPEAQGYVPGHGALPFQDFGYAVCGHLELAGQLRGAHA
jgi:hypothetical protein